jgi:excisionase family DNA binding protein
MNRPRRSSHRLPPHAVLPAAGYLTPEQAAELLGVSVHTLEKWRRSGYEGVGPRYRLHGRHTRVQQLYWAADGYPFFGQPQATGSGQPGIRGRHSDKCVDDYDWNTVNGAPVKLYTCSTAAAQKWEFSYVGGYYRIKNLHAAKCLDNLNGSAALNADVGLWTCTGGTNQDWSIIDRGNGWFSLRNRTSGLCLDNYEWNTANGARLSMYTCNGLDAQLWRRG